MKITFYSCYMNHHQLPVALELYHKQGVEYYFVAKYPFNQDRKKLGYEDMNESYPFIVRMYENDGERKKAVDLARTSDIIIHDTSFEEEERIALENGKIVFRYSEHQYKKNARFFLNFRMIYGIIRLNLHNKAENNKYLLCASAYRGLEAKFFHEYRGKCYKWGYFPPFYPYKIEDLIREKRDERVKLLWCGRFLKWKNTDWVIPIARYLQKKNLKFEILMVGEGEEKEKIESIVKREKLCQYIKFHSGVNYKKMRRYMEKADIYLFLSNHEEGWGAVLNEAMNSGCAVVANHLAGSVPYLIKNNYNGIIFHDNNIRELEKKIYYLCRNEKKREYLGRNAYYTIADEWNPASAAENFIRLCGSLKKGEKNLICSGPCSKA